MEELRGPLQFSLQEVDILLQPQLATRLGLQRIPVVELDGRRLVGLPTSAELAAFISAAADSSDNAKGEVQ